MLAKVIIENGQKKIQALTADTGTGAPVGSIIVVCSNILPSGYLGLGVQYDPTNYPALYQVLGTDTTPTASALGLPTLSSGQYAIKATSGLTENQQENVLNTINENNSYSTEEHKTGKKWIDGKDIYEKVVTSIYNVTTTSAEYRDTGAVLPTFNKLIKCKLIGDLANVLYYSNESGSTVKIASLGTFQILTGAQFNLEYTKTTDN